MLDVKFQIFISSPYKGLENARESVIKTILNMYQIPIGMEMFSADDDEQWLTIQETIDISDYYILILGHRYGSETSDSISFTEKEYNYAREIGIPILSYVQDRDIPVAKSDREDDPQKITKLDTFITKVTATKMCEFWKTEDELAKKIAVALPKIFTRKRRVGWIRGDKGISPEVSEELVKLSRENRELKDELEAYKIKIKTRSPNIECSLKIPDDVNFLDDKNLSHSTFTIQKLNDIPSHLSHIVGIEDLNKYNAMLPSQADTDQYNINLKCYYRMLEGSIDCSIIVKNTGNSPATELNLDIELPEGILFVTDNEIRDLKKPQISLPQNPIAKAEEIYQRDLLRVSNPLQAAIESLGRSSRITVNGGPNWIDRITDITPVSQNAVSLDVDENKVIIKIKKLLHTRETEINGIKLLPLNRGIFEIKIFAICEELEAKHVIDYSLAIS